MVLLYAFQFILAIKQMGFFTLSFLSMYCPPVLCEGETLAVRITLLYTEIWINIALNIHNIAANVVCFLSSYIFLFLGLHCIFLWITTVHLKSLNIEMTFSFFFSFLPPYSYHLYLHGISWEIVKGKKVIISRNGEMVLWLKGWVL